MMIRESKRQHGAALVVALLILSIIVALAASMTYEHRFNIRRLSNQLLFNQAYQYLLATQAIAQKALRYDAEEDINAARRVDHLDEVWAQEPVPFVLDDGFYTGQIFDLQGRFNINSLKGPTSNNPSATRQPDVPETAQQAIFIRLLMSLSDPDLTINFDQAREITEAMIDWIDADSNARGFACGEDDSYYNIQGRTPHKVPNQRFYSTTELRLICNMPYEVYLRLQDYVTVWPLDGSMVINLNTASEPLLRSVLVDDADARAILTTPQGSSLSVPPPIAASRLNNFLAQQKEGYTAFADVMSDISGLHFYPAPSYVASAKGYSRFTVGLYSEHFLLKSRVTLGDLQASMNSVFYRSNNGTIRLLAQSVNNF